MLPPRRNMMTKNIIPYDELGFRIYLINPEMHKLPDGTLVPSPNMKLLQDNVFKLLLEKKSRVTGNEVHFIRKYMYMTQNKFAEWLNLTNHSIVSQWESKDDKLTGMDYNTEVLMRLQMEAYLSKQIPAERFLTLKNMQTEQEPLYVDAA